MTKALVVIDMQNDFVEPTGSLSVGGATKIIPIVNNIRNKFENVLFSYDWHPKDHVSFVDNHPGHKVYGVVDAGPVKQVLFAAHCVQNTHGSELHKDIIKKDSDMSVYKGMKSDIDSYSCFFDVIKSNPTNADKQLRDKGIKTLYFCGVATDYCVKSSVIDALELGYEVYVIEDAIAAVDPTATPAAIQEMTSKGAKLIQSKDL